MIILNKDNIADQIFCTPKEIQISVMPFYYFKFVSRQTNAIIEYNGVNISPTDRYQKFIINTQALFSNMKEGFWTYYIKPQNNISGGDPNTQLLESGLMYLNSNDNFIPTKYEEQASSFKTYSK